MCLFSNRSQKMRNLNIRTKKCHTSSKANLSLMFYHILTSSVIYYWKIHYLTRKFQVNFMQKTNIAQITKQWVRYRFFKWNLMWNSQVSLESHSLSFKWKKSQFHLHLCECCNIQCASLSRVAIPCWILHLGNQSACENSLSYEILLNRWKATWNLLFYWLIDSRAHCKLCMLLNQ